MKRLLFILFVLTGTIAKAQVSVYTSPTPARTQPDSLRLMVSEKYLGRVYQRSVRIDEMPISIATQTALNAKLNSTDLNSLLSPYLTSANAASTYQTKGAYLTSETDPVFLAHVAHSITNTNISNWNTAFSWGNHATVGYLTAASLTAYLLKSTADTTYQAKGNYLTSFTELDPTVSSYVKGITSSYFTNGNTAYSWGNHALAGYITSSALSPYLLSSTAASTYQPIGSYLTYYTETDPIFTAHVASSITSTNISNWNTAYGWGNHASAGYLTSSSLTPYLLKSDSTLANRITANRTSINTNTTAIATKEPIISAGTTGQYWRGDKTWQLLSALDSTNNSLWHTAAYYDARYAAIGSSSGGGGSSDSTYFWPLKGKAVSSGVGDFVGTLNNRSLRFRTNNTERVVIDSAGMMNVTNSTKTQATFYGYAKGGGVQALWGQIAIGSNTDPNTGQTLIRHDNYRSYIENTSNSGNVGISLITNGTTMLEATYNGGVKMFKTLIGDVTQGARGVFDINNGTGWAYFGNSPTTIPSTSTSTANGLMIGHNYTGGGGEESLLFDTRVGNYPHIRFGYFNGTTVTNRVAIGQQTVAIGTDLTQLSNRAFNISGNQTSHPYPNITATNRLALVMTSANDGDHVYQTDGTKGVYVYKDGTGWVFAY